MGGGVVAGALLHTVHLPKHRTNPEDYYRWTDAFAQMTALLMLHVFLFFFFLTWKILQLNASRLYFPLVNFKCLLPLTLKASCALRLHFCALDSDEENPFLL